MKFPCFSIRTNVLSLIVFMGFWAFILAVVTLYSSTNYILENEKEAYGKLVKIHVTKLLDELNQNSINLAIKSQQDSAFQEAFKTRNKVALKKLSNDQFQQYYYTAGIVDIKQIIILDKNMKEISYSSSNTTPSLSKQKSVASFLNKAKQRKGTERIKPTTKLFVDIDAPLHVSLTAIGGLRIEGYMLVISNPLLALYDLEQQLGKPVSIFDKSNLLRYQSHKPEETYGLSEFEYKYFNDDNELVFNLHIHRDVTSLTEQVKQFIVYAAILALIITLFIVLGAITFFNKTLISPLEKVSKHMDKIAHSKSSLEQIDPIEGNKEIHDLVDSFNLMGAHINELNDELEGMAYRDTLTQIHNRRAFNKRLEELTKLSRKGDEGFCILILDLNKFKEVNDQYGHDTGDKLLKYVATQIGKSIRTTDMLARLGGDEFGIILPGITQKENAEQVAHKMLANACKEIQINNSTIQPTLSIGIAFYTKQSNSVEEVINQADKSMYEAKKGDGGYRC